MDYDMTFKNRAAEYNYAVQKYPHVLMNELSTAALMVDAKPNEVIVNIPGACVDISKYIPDSAVYKPYETNRSFSLVTGIPYSANFCIPEPPDSVDKVLSLASLHHATDEERVEFYKSVYRCLKPGGKLIIGDVHIGSREDKWLNEFVNKFNGHNGKFWSEEDTKLMTGFNVVTGFNVTTEMKCYPWTFTSQNEMVDFCRHLFGLKNASDAEIEEGLQKYLMASETEFDWSLIYFIATKPT
jgi:SAM-dependent methyltransferase